MLLGCPLTMQRSNDNQNQSLEEIKRTTALLSQRVNQLERLLDQKSISEAKVESGTVYQRESRLSLSNGMMKSDWQATSVTGSGSDFAMDYSDFAFGFSVSGNQVTITVGEVRQGTRVPVTARTSGSAPITINADQTWIYCTYAFGGTSAQVVSSVIEPVTTATTLNYPLHLWGVSGGIVSVVRILHLGDIIIPGVFA